MEMLQLTKNKNSEPVIICHLSQWLEGNDGLRIFTITEILLLLGPIKHRFLNVKAQADTFNKVLHDCEIFAKVSFNLYVLPLRTSHSFRMRKSHDLNKLNNCTFSS